MKDKKNDVMVLLGGGSLVGQNVMQALSCADADLKIVATNSVPDEPSLLDFDEVHLVPETKKDPGFLEKTLEKIINSQSVILIVPCRDDDVEFLARLAERRPHLASICLCGSSDLATIMLDKWRSYEFSQKHQLPFSPSALSINAADVARFVDEHGFPLLVKPRSGFASRNVRIILNKDQLEDVIGDENIVLQRYLESQKEIDSYLFDLKTKGVPLHHTFEAVKHSIQAMIAPDGSIVGMFTTLHRMKQGVSVLVEEDLSPDAKSIGELCASVFSSSGWRGPLNIQCQRMTDGQLYIYEYNGRFTGATAARAWMDFNEISLALEHFSGIKSKNIKDCCSRVERQLISRPFLNKIINQLQASGVWYQGSYD